VVQRLEILFITVAASGQEQQRAPVMGLIAGPVDPAQAIAIAGLPPALDRAIGYAAAIEARACPAIRRAIRS
jgi:hypothetical protein